jgi:O-6-methylguanine DNA methyltransferase
MKVTLGVGRRSTPAGAVKYAVRQDGAVVALGFEEHWETLVRWLVRRFGDVTFVPGRFTEILEAALDAYLAGDVTALDRVPVDTGGTELQRRVWAALRAIPAGQTRSYGDIARQVGAPRAFRAVGAANGANPVSIVVPCHRVVASDGTLHGYGGGLPRKEWLLRHEGALL